MVSLQERSQPHPRRRNRRAGIVTRIGLVAFVGLTSVACTGPREQPVVTPVHPGISVQAGDTPPPKPTPSLVRPEPTPAAVAESDEQILQGGITLLNPILNPEEVPMWRAIEIQPLLSIPRSEEEYDLEINKRLKTTADAMEQSDIPHMQDAKKFLDRNRASEGEIFALQLRPFLFDRNGHSLTTQVISYAHNEGLFFIVEFSADKMLRTRELTGINLAFEWIRITSYIEQLQTLYNPTRSLTEQFTDQIIQAVFARSYEKMVEAYLAAYANGYRDDSSSGLHRLALNYVRFGSNSEDSRWVDHIATTFIHPRVLPLFN